jgi:uncharacterized damage-inducible protein DinB
MDRGFRSADRGAGTLSAPPPEKAPPSTDGTLGGVISFLAYHETYHVGQAAYLSRWLGHAQIMG